MAGREGAGGQGAGAGFANRPQLGANGQITRNDLRPATNDLRPGTNVVRPGTNDFRPGNAAAGGLPGLSGGALRAGDAAAKLPGLGTNRPATAGVGDRLANAGSNLKPGAAGAGSRFGSDSIADRHQDLSGNFDQLKNNWGDGDWHSWTGPNGGQINHIGFWGPNGYWGHTGAWGPNGGHVGHTGGIGPGGAWGRTIGWGPNGNVWGHGGGVGAGGAYGWGFAGGPAGHWARGWGGWYNGVGPAWGNGRWDYLWNQYPVAMAFGATMWGLNSVAYAMGVGSYYNPYYAAGQGAYVDNQQVVAYDQPIVGDPSYETAEVANIDPATDPLTQAFGQARAAFADNQFEQALQLTDQALKLAPRDAAINEFRSLCLFALGRYRESAATIHAVLAAGPGWDWTTMSSLYSSVDLYTSQLRKLEEAATADPSGADRWFLLGYHYLTADYKDAAVRAWRRVEKLQPDDKLSADLVQMYGADQDIPPQDKSPTPPELDKPAYALDQLQGEWKAQQAGNEFVLNRGQDDAFQWSFEHDGKSQDMQGAYTVRGNNLVMQPDSGGTMLSTITLSDPGTLVFAPIGEATKLTFARR